MLLKRAYCEGEHFVALHGLLSPFYSLIYMFVRDDALMATLTTELSILTRKSFQNHT